MQKTSISSKSLTEEEALNRAAALCSGSEHCVSQIEERLERWGVPGEARQRIVDRLLEEGFIDESRFAHAYARDKMRYNHWGRVKTDQMLRLLGVGEAERRAALDQLPADEYRTLALHLLEAKRPTVRAASDYERRAKLTRYMVGKGFEPSLVFSLLGDEPEA